MEQQRINSKSYELRYKMNFVDNRGYELLETEFFFSALSNKKNLR